MMVDLISYCLYCSLWQLLVTGAAVVLTTTVETPLKQICLDQKCFLRTVRSSSSTSSGIISTRWRPLETNLSGSSSTPVEPIKPLLDLSRGIDSSFTLSHPVFDGATPKNVSLLAGQSAYLHCLVHNLANKSVSWIRQRDLHILTVGPYTYTTDQRYQVIHSRGSKDWILKIRYPTERDSGNYECQVSTKPVKTFVVHLNVYAAGEAYIIGAPDMHVDIGSTINLTCIITHSSQPPTQVEWHHDKEVVNYDSPRGGITLLTERGNITTAYLLIQNAQPSDSGNYSCIPSNTTEATLRLHVLKGLLLLSMMVEGAGLYMGPYFPFPQPRNISVHQGTLANLPCIVKQLGDKSVSWVRQRDANILTVDGFTFVRDERVNVHHPPASETWTLVIKYPQERDAGTYECQISTQPKMSKFVHLHVIVPEVEISGAVDKYVRKGSTAHVHCTVSSTVQLPDYIFWYHSGERLLEYDHPRLKILVSRRGGQGSEMSITSSLVISKATPSDAGNYTCLPSNLHSASIILHVLSDEHPAAMRTSSAKQLEPPTAVHILLVILLIFFLTHVQQEDFISGKRVPPVHFQQSGYEIDDSFHQDISENWKMIFPNDVFEKPPKLGAQYILKNACAVMAKTCFRAIS